MHFSLKNRFLMIIVSFSVILLIVVSVLNYYKFQTGVINHVGLKTLSIAKTVSVYIDPDLVYEYADGRAIDSTYNEIFDMLSEIKRMNSDIDNLYIVTPVSDEEVVYIFDVYTDEEINNSFKEFAAPGQKAFIVHSYAHSDDYIYLADDGDGVDMLNLNGQTISCSKYAMVTSDGNEIYICVDANLTNVNASFTTYLVYVICTVAIFGILLIIYCFLFFKHEILDPVSLIDEKAKAFRESSHLGDVDKYLLNIGASDEMGAHINGYNDLVKSIDKYIKEIQEISRENDRINFELSVATGMRMDMLPRLTPSSIDREGYSIFARLEPSLESGGAFYDYFYLEDDVIAAFSAVVEGSGVPAALFMVIAKILIKNHLQNGMSVDDVLDVTNNQLCEGNNAALFISAWVGIFNTTTGIFEYSSASHPEPLIISSNGDFRRVTPVKQSVPLGAWEDTPYEAYTDKLKAGDLFVLFNEGIVEATNNDSEEEFGIERLIGGICINYPKEVETINNEMYKEWTDFVGPNKEKYDFSLLMVKINE